jgi:hypothetical protein
MNALRRARDLIIAPAQAWDAIAREERGVQELYTRYVALLAAVGPLCYFVGFAVVGTRLGRTPMAHALAQAVAAYVLTLGAVYVLALLLAALAPGFGGERSFTRAFAVAAHAPTAAWLAGAFYIVPAISILALSGLYSLYLFYLGIPRLMRVPEERALPLTSIVVIAALVIAVAIDGFAALVIPAQVRGF